MATLACLRHLCRQLTGTVPERTEIGPLRKRWIDELLTVDAGQRPETVNWADAARDAMGEE